MWDKEKEASDKMVTADRDALEQDVLSIYGQRTRETLQVRLAAGSEFKM
jgi:hypothetical protein